MADAKAIPHLYLLGGIELRDVEQPATDRLLAQSKLAALCALLALAPDGRLQRRDRLVGMLWPELDQSHARASLRRVVHATREALGPDVIRSRGDEEIGIGPDILTSDVDAFSRAILAGELNRAIELHRRELMPGFHLNGCAEFSRWLDERRNELRQQSAAAAWALAQRHEGGKEFSLAGRWARSAVSYSWDDERVLRRALGMLDRIGDRVGALKLYDDFVKRLKQELDAEPSPETRRLVEQLRG